MVKLQALALSLIFYDESDGRWGGVVAENSRVALLSNLPRAKHDIFCSLFLSEE
jgi:hypothetical protein